MEDVAAVWDQTQRFVILKLVQAHRACQGFFRNHEALHGGVEEGGEALDDVRADAAGLRTVAARCRRRLGFGFFGPHIGECRGRESLG